MTESVIGIDASTTSVKAVAWSSSGQPIAEGRAGYALDNPAPDGWEQDAEAWWSATRAALCACSAALGPAASAVRGVCITHQRETFVLCDSQGRPLHPALVWMDARGRARVDAAIAGIGAGRAHAISGKPPCITPSFYKLFALFERHPELRRPDLRVLDVHAFLTWKLLGRSLTSLASADPLGLVDLAARRWSPELLAALGLDASHMPELVEPGSVMGTLDAALAGDCGLPAGTPLVAGAGDGQAAGLGAGIDRPGRAYLNLGTAIVSGVLSHELKIDRAFRTLYGAAPGSYFLETDLQGGTFTLSWFADRFLVGEVARTTGVTLRSEDVLADLERRAAALVPGADGLLVVPYWNGVMNPYWDDDATGIVVGLHGGHGPEHFHRALLEGIAFEQHLHTTAVEAALGAAIDIVVVMGGGSKSALWCQLLADVLDKPVLRARSAEATSLGAGILAAVATGLHSDLAAATAAMTGTGAGFSPGPARGRYRELGAVFATLYPALRASLTELSRLRRATP